MLPKTKAQIRKAAEEQFISRMTEKVGFFMFNRLNDTTDLRAGQIGIRSGHLAAQPSDFVVNLPGKRLFLAEVKGTLNEKDFHSGGAFQKLQTYWISSLADFNQRGAYEIFIRAFTPDLWFRIDAVDLAPLLGKRIPYSHLIDRGFQW